MPASDHDYELFISYSRKDDRPREGDIVGWVTALREEILRDHARFTTEPLSIFFDTDEIKDMDDWRHRILGALRRSRILLVCLSPDYFSSEYCRWEFDEYVARQAAHRAGLDTFAEVYFVTVPEKDGEAVGEDWWQLLRRKSYTDLREWFPAGVAAIREEAVRKRLETLGTSLWARIERARRSDGVPGNLRRMNPFFVGRTKELRELHESLAVGSIGVVTAVQGLGGQGKTELAVAYGQSHAASYPAGLWVLGAEGHDELLPLLGGLCLELGLPPQAGPQETGAQRGRRVLRELEARSLAVKESDPDGGAACLLVLDNVSEVDLLSGPQIAQLPQADWLRIVATTRIGTDRLASVAKNDLAFVHVDSLETEDAVKLIRDRQPPRDDDGAVILDPTPAQWRAPRRFANEAEDEAAARAIAVDLGGFTLAVEAVAVYLGLHPELSPGDYLEELRAAGLMGAADLMEDEGVEREARWRQKITGEGKRAEKQFGVVLERTLASLELEERHVLDLAALLPPDQVVWIWLRTAAAMRFESLSPDAPGGDARWGQVQRRLTGLRLMTPSDHPEVMRLHRIVGAFLVEREEGDSEQNQRSIDQVVYDRAFLLQRDVWISPGSVIWESQPIAAFVLGGSGQNDATRMGRIAGIVGEVERIHGGYDVAFQMLRRAVDAHELVVEANPGSGEAARDVSVSLNKLGDFLQRRGGEGDAEQALAHYERSLEVRERLLEANPGSGEAARDVSVSLERLGDFLQRRGGEGDAEQALAHYERSLEVRERLLEANPGSGEAARDVSASLERLGDFLQRRGGEGDAEQALAHYERSLEVRERLLEANPGSGEAARDVSVSLNKLGDFLQRRGGEGDAEQALAHYERSLEVRERLLEANPGSGEAARDLKVLLERLAGWHGEHGGASGKTAAVRLRKRALGIAHDLLQRGPSSWHVARSYVISAFGLGQAALAANDQETAQKAFGEVHRILTQADRAGLALDPPMRQLLVQLDGMVGGS